MGFSGLMELIEGDKVEGEGGLRPERLGEHEEKLALHIENALDHLDASTTDQQTRTR